MFDLFTEFSSKSERRRMCIRQNSTSEFLIDVLINETYQTDIGFVWDVRTLSFLFALGRLTRAKRYYERWTRRSDSKTYRLLYGSIRAVSYGFSRVDWFFAYKFSKATLTEHERIVLETYFRRSTYLSRVHS